MHPLARHIGHRGLAGISPENTLPSIRLAAERGFRWIEIDTRPSKDGVALLSHDDSLSRCGGGAARLSRLTAKEATQRRVAAGQWGFADATVPLLVDVLRFATAQNLGVVIEIKANKGEEVKAADSAAAVVADCAGSFILSSFNADVLRRLRQNLPRLPLAWNLSHPLDWRALRRELQLNNLHIRAGRFGGGDIAAMKAAGLGVYCFTVNDERQQKELFAAGADGVFTDFPPAAGLGNAP